MATPHKIMLIDDEEGFRETSARLFKGRGFEVITAENGQAALDALHTTAVDVILVDLKMPVMGGEEFLKRAHPLYPEVPMIVLTGHGTLDLAVRCMKRGAYDFLSKPIDFERLFLTIQRALEKRGLEQRAKRFQDDIVRSYLDLNTEKKRLETIINCMANGVMVTDRNLQIVLHNPALIRMTGYTGAAENPLPVTAILNDESLLETLRRIQRHEVGEKEFISQEICIAGKVLRAISAPTLGADRNVFWTVTGAVTVLEDISVFKELDSMKTDFVNMVAHELRSPLVSVRQLQTVLLEGMAGPLGEKQGDFVRRGIRKIDSLLELINDLLSVARLEGGRLAQQPARVDVSGIIAEVVALFEQRASDQRVNLTCSCECPLPVHADPGNIEKVLNNLISNAINYSPGGGRVSVFARPAGRFVEISVCDTGVGIPSEELPRIFEKFYRVKNPRTRHVTGTGLGLSLVKGIVEGCGGRIDVESSPDHGSTFRVLLPLMEET